MASGSVATSTHRMGPPQRLHVLTSTCHTWRNSHAHGRLAMGASASATLGTFGFAGSVQSATHLVYSLETTQQIRATDTVEYVECCKAAECGYGFVSSLVYGHGEYARAEEYLGEAQADFLFAAAEGSAACERSSGAESRAMWRLSWRSPTGARLRSSDLWGW